MPIAHQLLTWSLWCYAVLWAVDIGAMIVTIMAYTGAQSSDDRKIIKQTFITFSSTGHHIQRLAIALPSLGLIMHIVLPTMASIRMGRLERDYSCDTARAFRRWIVSVPLVYHLLCLGAWATIVALQAEYVPILGTQMLPECVEFGDELSQCGMLTAGWILAMVYCVFEMVLVSFYLGVVRRVTVEMKTFQEGTPVRLHTIAQPNATSAASVSRSLGPVRYYAVQPPGDAESGFSRPSYTADQPPPPYTEVK